MVDLQNQIAAKIDPSDFENASRIQNLLVNDLSKELSNYRNELAGVRDRIWPQFLGSLKSPMTGIGTSAGLSLSLISGPAYLLAASVVAAAIEPLKVFLDWRAEYNKIRRNVSPAVAYLSEVAKQR
jgi:hypothetical protein